MENANISKVVISVSLLVAFGLLVGLGVLVFSGLNSEFCDQVNLTVVNTTNDFYPGAVTTTTVPFLSGGGNNNTLYLSVPRNVTVLSSSFNLTGQYSQDWNDDFNVTNYGAAVGDYMTMVVEDDNPLDSEIVFYTNSTDDTIWLVENANLTGNGVWTVYNVTSSVQPEHEITSTYDDFNDYYLVAYRQIFAGDIVVDWGGPGAWNHEVVFDGASAHRPDIVARDDEDYVGMSFYVPTGTSLRFAERDFAGWQNETVAAAGGIGTQATITWDDYSSEYHIFALNSTAIWEVYHFNGTFANWSVSELILPVGSGAGNMNMETEQCGTDTYLLWLNNTANELYFTYGTTGAWTNQEITDTPYNNFQSWDLMCNDTTAYVSFVNTDYATYNLQSVVYDVGTNTVLSNTTVESGAAPMSLVGSAINVHNNLSRIAYATTPGTNQQINVSWVEEGYPTDVCVDVNVNGTCDFTQAGQLTTNNNTGDFSVYLNTLVTGCATDPCNVTLQVNSTTLGNLFLNNLVVNWSTGGLVGPCDRPAAAASNNFIGTLGESTTWVALMSAIVILTFVVVYLGKVWIKPGGR